LARIETDPYAARMIVEKALPIRIHEPYSGIVMIGPRGEYTGACIFNNYVGRDIHFTCVSTGLLGMREARYVARYVFGKLGCSRCTAITRATNERAIKALVQLGFKYEGTMREFYPDTDGAVFGLLRSEQRIVRLYGRRFS
jgi:hypothetical protein